MVDHALAYTREQLASQQKPKWVTTFDATEREAKRDSGRRLMQLLGNLLAADDDETDAILQDVRDIGNAYAEDALRSDMGLTAVLSAITFFRDQILETKLTAPDAIPMDQESGRQAIQRINSFFSTVLLAVAAAFD